MSVSVMVMQTQTPRGSGEALWTFNGPVGNRRKTGAVMNISCFDPAVNVLDFEHYAANVCLEHCLPRVVCEVCCER
jgi:hypothetical protein